MRKWWIALFAAALLLLPIPQSPLRDGGTRVWQALTYRVVHWRRCLPEGIFEKTQIYGFPQNLLPLEQLWEEMEN